MNAYDEQILQPPSDEETRRLNTTYSSQLLIILFSCTYLHLLSKKKCAQEHGSLTHSSSSIYTSCFTSL